MALWIFFFAMVIFALISFLIIKRNTLRYILSALFLIIALACSTILMLNDTQHLGMHKYNTYKNYELVSLSPKLNLTLYKSLGNGNEKIFIYADKEHPKKHLTTEIKYNVNTKVEHMKIDRPILEVQKTKYTYNNKFWKFMLLGLGDHQVEHYSYIFKVPQNWLVLQTDQVKQLPQLQKQLIQNIKVQAQKELPGVIKQKIMEAMMKNPNMTPSEKQQLIIQTKKEFINQLREKMIAQLMQKLEKESL